MCESGTPMYQKCYTDVPQMVQRYGETVKALAYHSAKKRRSRQPVSRWRERMAWLTLLCNVAVGELIVFVPGLYRVAYVGFTELVDSRYGERRTTAALVRCGRSLSVAHDACLAWF
jgi:hypothetical protein